MGDMGRGQREWMGKEQLSNDKDVEEAEDRRGTNTKRHSIHTFYVGGENCSQSDQTGNYSSSYMKKRRRGSALPSSVLVEHDRRSTQRTRPTQSCAREAGAAAYNMRMAPELRG